jgi:hypothetical protein
MSEEAQQSAPVDAPVEEPAPEDVLEPAPNFMKKLLAKKMNLVIISAVVAIVVIAAVVVGGGGAGGGGMFSKKTTAAPAKMVSINGSYPLKGPQVAAGATQEFPIEFNSSSNASQVTNVYEVKVACSWTDDYSGSEPDSMTFELVAPDGQNDSKNTQGTSGQCQLDIKMTNITDSKADDNTKGWVLKVTCDFAGHKDAGPFGFLIHPDAGNNFDAKIDYNYYGYEAKK